MDLSRAIPWRAESLRLTTFVQKVPESLGWERIVGEPPESKWSQPKLKIVAEQGQFEGALLVFQVQPGRADWFQNLNASSDLGASLRTFESVAKRWLDGIGEAQRLAFGAVLIVPTGDSETGYRTLQAYIPGVSIDPEGSRDFLYQINRPRQSKSLPGLKLNRLSKWSVGLNQRIQIRDDGIPEVTEQSYVCRLELDLSTDAAYQKGMSGSQLTAIWNELTAAGIEIATKGDQP